MNSSAEDNFLVIIVMGFHLHFRLTYRTCDAPVGRSALILLPDFEKGELTKSGEEEIPAGAQGSGRSSHNSLGFVALSRTKNCMCEFYKRKAEYYIHMNVNKYKNKWLIIYMYKYKSLFFFLVLYQNKKIPR